MTVYDIVIVSIVGIFALWGLWRGLIQAAFNAAGLIIGILAAWRLAPVFGKQIPPAKVPEAVRIVAAAIIIILVVWILAKIAAFVVKKIIRHGPVKSVDRLGGFLLGAAKGSLIVVSATILVLATPLSATIKKAAKDSPVLHAAIQISGPLVKRYKQAVSKSISKQLATAIGGAQNLKSSSPATKADLPGKIDEDIPDLATLTLALDTLSPKTEELIKSLLKGKDFMGMDFSSHFDQLKASGATVDISLDEFPAETRSFINQALRQPDATGIDLNNIDLEGLKSGSASELKDLIGEIEDERIMRELEKLP